MKTWQLYDNFCPSIYLKSNLQNGSYIRAVTCILSANPMITGSFYNQEKIEQTDPGWHSLNLIPGEVLGRTGMRPDVALLTHCVLTGLKKYG